MMAVRREMRMRSFWFGLPLLLLLLERLAGVGVGEERGETVEEVNGWRKEFADEFSSGGRVCGGDDRVSVSKPLMVVDILEYSTN
jgi:hypothetical protein